MDASLSPPVTTISTSVITSSTTASTENAQQANGLGLAPPEEASSLDAETLGLDESEILFHEQLKSIESVLKVRAQMVSHENAALAQRLSTLNQLVSNDAAEEGEMRDKVERAKQWESELLTIEKSMDERSQALREDNETLMNQLNVLETKAEQAQKQQIARLKALEESLMEVLMERALQANHEAEASGASVINNELLDILRSEMTELQDRARDNAITTSTQPRVAWAEEPPHEGAENLSPAEAHLEDGKTQAAVVKDATEPEAGEEDLVDAEAEAEELRKLWEENRLLREELASLQRSGSGGDHQGESLDEGDDEQDDDEEEDEEEGDEDEQHGSLDQFERRAAQLAALRNKLNEMCAVLDAREEILAAGGSSEGTTVAANSDSIGPNPTEGEGEDPSVALLDALLKLEHLEKQAKKMAEENAELEQSLKELKEKEAMLDKLASVPEEPPGVDWELFCNKVESDDQMSKIVVFIDNLQNSPEMQKIDFNKLRRELSLPLLPMDSSAFLIALYTVGVNPSVRPLLKDANWLSYLRDDIKTVDAALISDLLEMFMTFRSNVQYYFIGCDYHPYVSIFEKAAKKYKIRSLSILGHDTGVPNPIHASFAAMGYPVKIIGDIFE